MNTFPHVPASAISISGRKIVYGHGVNDADYKIEIKIDGKKVACPFYRKWVSMLQRCYSPAYHLNKPTYQDCTVAAEWLTFSVFRSWMVGQYWEGMCLDKDMLSPGNKVYSPETCVFVSQAINNLLTDSAASRGVYPQGVDFDKRRGKYKAQISLYGKLKHLGLFATPEEASTAYLIAKSAYIIEVAQTQPDNIKAALIRHAELLLC